MAMNIGTPSPWGAKPPKWPALRWAKILCKNEEGHWVLKALVSLQVDSTVVQGATSYWAGGQPSNPGGVKLYIYDKDLRLQASFL